MRRVSYDVDAARVGQRTDFDKLKLEVTTNGSMTPKDAVKDAAEILIRYLSIFTDIDAADLAIRPDGAAAEAAAPSAHGMENILIEELELGVRSYNCLKRVGIETIGDLISKTEAELAAIPNFGKKSIEEVKETLAGPRPQPAGRRVRHQRKGRKLGRDPAHRKALHSNMCGALFAPRPHPDDRGQGEGAAADRREADHPRAQGSDRRGSPAPRGRVPALARTPSTTCSIRSGRGSPSGRAATRAS